MRPCLPAKVLTILCVLFTLVQVESVRAETKLIKTVGDWKVYCSDEAPCAIVQAIRSVPGGEIVKIGMANGEEGSLELVVRTSTPYLPVLDSKVESIPPPGVHSLPFLADGRQLFNVLFHPEDCQSGFCERRVILKGDDARRVLDAQELSLFVATSKEGGIIASFKSTGAREALSGKP